MTEFEYIITKEAFNKATTIKERMRIFKEALNKETTPYNYLLCRELYQDVRLKNTLNKHRIMINNKRNQLTRQLQNANLSYKEIKLIFGDSPLDIPSLKAEKAIKLCNIIGSNPIKLIKAPLINSNFGNRYIFGHLEYSLGNAIAFLQQIALIKDRDNNTLFKLIMSSLPKTTYKQMIKPLEDSIAALQDFKNYQTMNP